MITEDYCSFEVAKLLKEKGFDCWQGNGGDVDGSWYCTHALAMKWLREKYNLHIQPYIVHDDYAVAIGSIPQIDQDCGAVLGHYDTYEQAVEAALKYSLENLV